MIVSAMDMELYMFVAGDPSNIHKQRIFSMIFAKNPVKSILPIWSISRNAYFSMSLAYLSMKKWLIFVMFGLVILEFIKEFIQKHLIFQIRRH